MHLTDLLSQLVNAFQLAFNVLDSGFEHRVIGLEVQHHLLMLILVLLEVCDLLVKKLFVLEVEFEMLAKVLSAFVDVPLHNSELALSLRVVADKLLYDVLKFLDTFEAVAITHLVHLLDPCFTLKQSLPNAWMDVFSCRRPRPVVRALG